jgi:hypothetical protein
MVVLAVGVVVDSLLVVDLEQEIPHQYHHHKEIMELLEILVELDMVEMEVVQEEREDRHQLQLVVQGNHHQ